MDKTPPNVMNQSPPNCPQDGLTMVLRTARKGRYAGSQFWGCSQFPKCKEILPFDGNDGDDDHGESNGNPPTPREPQITNERVTSRETLPLISVNWSEQKNRSNWISEYVNIGSFPGLLIQSNLNLSDQIKRCIGQVCFLTPCSKKKNKPEESVRLIMSSILKILNRGRTPFPTPAIEQNAIDESGLLDYVRFREENEIEIGWDWLPSKKKKFLPQNLLKNLCRRGNFTHNSEITDYEEDEECYLDSQNEKYFYKEWITKEVGREALHWIHPQASLEKITGTSGDDLKGFRRVDFLFSHPLSSSLVIELDGEEHETAVEVDKDRDNLLNKNGIQTIRIPNQELIDGSGPNLNNVRDHILNAINKQNAELDTEDLISKFIINCSWGTKLQYALVKCLEYSWLHPREKWEITLSDISKVYKGAIKDFLIMLEALEDIYDVEIVPNAVIVKSNDQNKIIYKSSSRFNWEEYPCEETEEEINSSVKINLAASSSPFDDTGLSSGDFDIILVPTYLPVDFSTKFTFISQRIKCQSEGSKTGSLNQLLQFIFRKRELRQGQDKGIMNALEGVDSIVLLPTGWGKSIIYQLAGLIMPGVTLIIDPINALIDDQIEGLKKHGIDRAIGITKDSMNSNNRKIFSESVGRGEYQFIFISPERLQSPDFRETLTVLAQSTLINLAVIDEAHCVSEWGHDFRPAYLNLGRNLRAFCADNSNTPPSLIALTGTASRAVLRDVRVDLEIDNSNSKAIIRPETFNRKELSFIIRKAKSGNALSVLKGLMNIIPEEFGMSASSFYRPNGRNTCAGIIFNPFVNGPNGLMKIPYQIKNILGYDPAVYSGGAPKGYDFRE